MRTSIRIHHTRPAATLPAHELAARRRRTRTERPIASASPRPGRRPTPSPSPDALRKTADTRFPTTRVTLT